MIIGHKTELKTSNMLCTILNLNLLIPKTCEFICVENCQFLLEFFFFNLPTWQVERGSNHPFQTELGYKNRAGRILFENEHKNLAT
jgi:hypothetical protein